MLPTVSAVKSKFSLAVPFLVSPKPVTARSYPVCPLNVKYGSGFPSVSEYLFSISFKFQSFTMQSSDIEAIISKELGRNWMPRTTSICERSVYFSDSPLRLGAFNSVPKSSSSAYFCWASGAYSSFSSSIFPSPIIVVAVLWMHVKFEFSALTTYSLSFHLLTTFLQAMRCEVSLRG